MATAGGDIRNFQWESNTTRATFVGLKLIRNDVRIAFPTGRDGGWAMVLKSDMPEIVEDMDTHRMY